jgi:hypothetical protein
MIEERAFIFLLVTWVGLIIYIVFRYLLLKSTPKDSYPTEAKEVNLAHPDRIVKTLFDLTLFPEADKLRILNSRGDIVVEVSDNSLKLDFDHIVIDGNRIDVAPAGSLRRKALPNGNSNARRPSGRSRLVRTPYGYRLPQRLHQLPSSCSPNRR